MSDSRNLVYTIAFDSAGSTYYRSCAKILASGMLRARCHADLMIIRNRPEPIFFLQRQGVQEMYIESAISPAMIPSWARDWRSKARELFDADGYASVMYLDADCLVRRNIDHLFEQPAEILFEANGGRARSAASHAVPNYFVVSGSLFGPLMSEWEAMGQDLNQLAAWRSVLENCDSTRQRFERDTVGCPLLSAPNGAKNTDPAIVHAKGPVSPRRKLELLFSEYIRSYWVDDSMTLLNILET